jgi:hypothetical protein
MSINGDYVKRMTSEEAANLYQQAVTPSIMSSHSNKRQSHHLQQQVVMQQQMNDTAVTSQ